MVKNLREKTGAGFGECKKALVTSDGDVEKAIEILRKKGAASAAKRSEKSAKEGIVAARISADEKTGILVEVNCETDFVAKNEGFVAFVDAVLKAYLENDVKDVPELLKLKVGNDTVEDLYNGILAKFSEKIEIRRIFKLKTAGFVSVYNHFNKNLAVLVEASVAADAVAGDKEHEAIHDVAMQIAALNPGWLSRDQVDSERINKEVEIYKELAIKEGKKPEMAERVAQGKLNKFYQDSCLLEQEFSKDTSMNIAAMLKNTNPELKVVSFTRFFIGEDQKA